MSPSRGEAPSTWCSNLERILGRAEFTDGWHELAVTCLRAASGWAPKLSSPGESFCIVRQSPRLLRWHAEVGTFPLGSSQEADPAVASLAEVLDGVARDDAPELFAKHSRLRFEVGNVISRDFTDPKAQGYTSTVHRDLDETAVGNLARRGASVFLNFWVPFSPIVSDHLAICLPSSVDLPAQVGAFKGLTGDRTALRWDKGQRWVMAADLKPGDVMIWQSDAVYHANLAQPSHEGDQEGVTEAALRRKSVDLRLWYFGTAAADR